MGAGFNTSCMLDAAHAPMQCNPRLEALVCLRCEAEHPLDEHDGGCPRCLRDGFPSNVAARYRSASDAPAATVELPYPGRLSLGEGGTPLLQLPGLAAAIGVGRLSLKLEWCNPTGSHKDRMSAQLVARASERGYREMVGASSGNGGVSIAAYAARAGLAAEIVATPELPRAYRAALHGYGARISYETDSLARWRRVAERVTAGAYAATNYRLPAVGTDPFGVEGYKTIAAEIIAAGEVPDLIVVPTSRGDLLSGLHLGLRELRRTSVQLVAAEPFPRLARVLAGEDYRGVFEGRTAQFSIAGSTVTYQAVHALRESRGTAIAVDDARADAARRRLAASGLHTELSSAAALAALQALAAGGKLRDRHALLVLTGSGFRDPTTWSQDQPEGAMRPEQGENRS